MVRYADHELFATRNGEHERKNKATETIGVPRYQFDGTFKDGYVSVKKETVFHEILREDSTDAVVLDDNDQLLEISKNQLASGTG